MFMDSINVFDCRLSGVVSIVKVSKCDRLIQEGPICELQCKKIIQYFGAFIFNDILIITLNNTFKCAHINVPISSYIKVRLF